MPTVGPDRSDPANGEPVWMYHFGQFTLDDAERRLFHEGNPVRIKPKALELLFVLLKNVNTVVSKEELINDVWHDAFVEEANLAVHISALRKLFRIAGGSGVTIETIPKVGYRLAVQNYRRTPLEASTISGKRFFQRRSVLTAGLLLVILAAAGAVSLVRSRRNAIDPNGWRVFQCPYGAGSGAGVACDDPVAAFSIDSNPSGQWTYGYTPAEDLKAFTKFDFTDRNSYFEAVPGMPINIWRTRDRWQPSIMLGTSDEVILPQSAFSLPPGMLNLHPGPNCERSVLRWTSPEAGIFKLEGAFWAIDIHDTTSDFKIMQNGILILTSGDIKGYGYERYFLQTPQVMAGDSIDFSVGCGEEGYKSDSTGLRLTVEKTDPWR